MSFTKLNQKGNFLMKKYFIYICNKKKGDLWHQQTELNQNFTLIQVLN